MPNLLAFRIIVMGVTLDHFLLTLQQMILTVYIALSLKISTFAVRSLHVVKNKIIDFL